MAALDIGSPEWWAEQRDRAKDRWQALQYEAIEFAEHADELEALADSFDGRDDSAASMIRLEAGLDRQVSNDARARAAMCRQMMGIAGSWIGAALLEDGS